MVTAEGLILVKLIPNKILTKFCSNPVSLGFVDSDLISEN